MSWLGRTHPSSTCLSVSDGSKSSGDFLCVFSSFDARSEIPEYVLSYLAELRRQGCEIVFVSTSPELAEAAIEQLKPHCVTIVHRKNVGLDFASWKLGLDLVLKNGQYRGIILANDSMFGPLRGLDREFEELRAEDQQVLGMTDSTEFQHHIQSYFVYIPFGIFNSIAFRKYWKQVVALKDKAEIIRRYEVGLSNHLTNCGVQIRALYPSERLQASAVAMGEVYQFSDRLKTGTSMNPTLHYWQILLDEFQFPFVKRGLFVNCPVTLLGMPSFLARLRKNQDAMSQQILRYLNSRSR